MKPDSHNKTIFRSIWGWKGKSSHLLQKASSVPPALPTKLIQLAHNNVEAVLKILNTSSEGLSELQSDLRLHKIGLNEIAHEKPPKWYIQLLKTFQNPLAILLIILAVIALLTGDIRAAVIIFSMVVFSVILRFSQEFRSSQAAEKLREMVHTTATVSRKDPRKDISPSLAQDMGLTLNLDVPSRQEIPIKFLVPGDVVFLGLET
ncbi:cation-transporting P-type ATPase [Scytonema sp. UIC 10036]|uniref:cation-transporting P-type ATPase n=1 Tax=Scytonema sp. UIC 10036 TaxID=2304196 RepID=UPI001FA9DDF7|nr:cation-transporting P-type ATPase [Scytonema sp. UIC 10036]